MPKKITGFATHLSDRPLKGGELTLKALETRLRRAVNELNRLRFEHSVLIGHCQWLQSWVECLEKRMDRSPYKEPRFEIPPPAFEQPRRRRAQL